MSYDVTDITLDVEGIDFPLSGRRFAPVDPISHIILHHGAGVGFIHRFMQRYAHLMAEKGHSVIAYNFKYMEAGKKRPDNQKVTVATIKEVFQLEQNDNAGVPIFLAGKSYGGRMSSWAVYEYPDLAVQGLIYLGFPLHAPGRDSDERAAHLSEMKTPMIFLQGTRDKLANLDFLKPVVKGVPNAEIFIIEGADHGFHVPKSSGMTDDEVMQLLATKSDAFIRKTIP